MKSMGNRFLSRKLQLTRPKERRVRRKSFHRSTFVRYLISEEAVWFIEETALFQQQPDSAL
jgi:hypothetical protein